MSDIEILDLVEVLRIMPFPDRREGWLHEGVEVFSNAHGHIAVVAESPDFWDGSSSVEAAREMAAIHDHHRATLSTAWGEPRTVEPERGPTSVHAESLIALGCWTALVWDLDSHSVSLRVGQVDKEFEIQVIVFVTPPPSPPWVTAVLDPGA